MASSSSIGLVPGTGLGPSSTDSCLLEREPAFQPVTQQTIFFLETTRYRRFHQFSVHLPRPILFAFRPETAGSDQVVRHLLLSGAMFLLQFVAFYLFSASVRRHLAGERRCLDGEQVSSLLLWAFVLYKEGIKTVIGVSLTLGWLAGLLFIAEHCREQFILVPALLSTPIIVTGGLKTAIAEIFAASSMPRLKTPAPLAALHWRLGMNRRIRNGS